MKPFVKLSHAALLHKRLGSAPVRLTTGSQYPCGYRVRVMDSVMWDVVQANAPGWNPGSKLSGGSTKVPVLLGGVGGDGASDGVLKTLGGGRYDSEEDCRPNTASRSGNADAMPQGVCRTFPYSTSDVTPALALEQRQLVETRVGHVAGEGCCGRMEPRPVDQYLAKIYVDAETLAVVTFAAVAVVAAVDGYEERERQRDAAYSGGMIASVHSGY